MSTKKVCVEKATTLGDVTSREGRNALVYLLDEVREASKYNINISLPNGTISMKDAFWSGYNLDIKLCPTPAEMSKFYKNAAKYLYDIGPTIHVDLSSDAPKSKFARINLAAGDVPYSIRFESAYGKVKLCVEIPKVAPSETADGYIFYQTPRFDIFGISAARMARRYENAKKILEDVAVNFGFSNVSEMSPNKRLTQVCIVPREISKDEFQDFLPKALSRGILEFEKDTTNGELHVHKTHYYLNVGLHDKPFANVSIWYSCCEADSSHHRVDELIEYTLAVMPIAFGEDTKVSFREYEDVYKEPGKIAKAFSAVGKVLSYPLELAKMPIRQLDKSILSSIRENRDYHRQIAEAREGILEKVTTQKLDALQLPKNKDFGDSCFTVVGPELQKEINEEAAAKFSDYLQKQKEQKAQKLQ